jgi:hypothetical protein
MCRRAVRAARQDLHDGKFAASGYTADTTKVHDEVSSDRTVSWTVDYYKSI